MNRGRKIVDLVLNKTSVVVAAEKEIRDTDFSKNIRLNNNNGTESEVPIVFAEDNFNIGFIKMTESFRIVPETRSSVQSKYI